MPKVINKKKRKFKLTTPGQVRDFEILVKNRRFQKYEEVTPKEEDAPANATGPAIANWDPLLGGKRPKIFLKRKRKVSERVDGRSKAYRQTVKRIKERQVRKQQKEVEQRFSQFSQQANPFREETNMSNKKYLETKDNSLESAVKQSVETEVIRPHDHKPILTLPKNRYLEVKEDSLEYAVVRSIAEGLPVRPGAPKPATPALPRQFKDPKKEKMVGTKSGTKVVDKGDPKYKGAPEHESVIPENGDHPDMGDHEHDEKGGVKGKLKGRKSFNQFQKKDKEDQDKDPVGKKQDDLDRDDEAQATRSKKRPTAEGDKPEQGKVYALTGKSNEPSIARGDSWKKSVVKKKPAPVKTAGMATKPLKSVFVKKDENLANFKGKKAKAFKKEEVEETNPLIAAAARLIEKEVKAKDTRRTDDAIDAYDKSKDASRDADWDTEHGKKGKGDKEKKYAKKERGEIDKDDPDWKHKKGNTGMHGESKETEAGDRNVGSSQYLKYTSDLTPGQGITSDQAKKADVAKKIEQQRQRTAATGIDDANVPGHKPPKLVGMKALKQKFKANRTAVRQKQARQSIATPKKEEMDLDAIIAKKLPEAAVNPMGAPSNAPIGRSVIGNNAPEKVSPAAGSPSSQASPTSSIPGESGMEKVMDTINRIVKSGHSEKIHDNVIDKDTASAIQATYAKVNAANQEKMEKVMSKDAASMEKVSKFSKKNA